jgi:hypothetical protein
MQIKLWRKSLARPSDRSSAVTRLIAHIFQGTDPVEENATIEQDDALHGCKILRRGKAGRSGPEQRLGLMERNLSGRLFPRFILDHRHHQ